jgi:hypothetical protein
LYPGLSLASWVADRRRQIEVIVNRCVVYELTNCGSLKHGEFGIQNVVLCASPARFATPAPGLGDRGAGARPTPQPAWAESRSQRLGEGERIRRKQTAGLDLFTTQFF